MKNIGQPLNSLMKFSPVNDLFQEPRQTYTSKGGWFAVDSESKANSATFKPRRGKQKKS